LVLQRFSVQDSYGHYRVIVGYNDKEGTFITFDPILGRNYNISYTEFTELWKPGSTFSTCNWTLLITPNDIFLTELMAKYQFSMNESTERITENGNQVMKAEDIYLILSAFAVTIGAIGGIPQIMRWFKPKPNLKISKVFIEKKPDEKINIHLEVKNERKWWRRNQDAKYVEAKWFMMDKDRDQWGGVHSITLTPYLMTDTKISKTLNSAHHFRPEGSPHTIVVLVSCQEGVSSQKIINYVVMYIKPSS